MPTADRISTPFGFDSTAAEVIAGIDLSGKRAVVTGGSSGIGVETARALASAGAAVTLAVRNASAGARVAAEITASTGTAVSVGALDLADLASVAAFVAAWDGPLDLLINNAGVMALPELQLDAAGIEQQFATNHVGHFALTVGLHDALAAASGNARVVSLSSRGHLRSPVVFEDINFTDRAYDPWLAYGQSKTANILLAVEATRRWADDGIFANAVHPGAIAETNLSRHMEPGALAALRDSGQFTFKSIEQGASTSVLLATSPQLEGIGGRYFEDDNEAEVLAEVTPEAGAGVAAYALDPESAERLWELSLELVG
ncbi:MAG: short-chain dehydrogenase/reductase [Conexibacter sp.]|nr:short-chain dehydrogenase/reductase [Conexibacter sp.]